MVGPYAHGGAYTRPENGPWTRSFPITDIAFIGAGHVGLVSAACMAACGHRVRVYDVDSARTSELREGAVPFYEPGLGEILRSGRSSGLLSFHDRPEEAIPLAELSFICVGTLNGPDGGVDLSGVVSATVAVAEHARPGSVLVNRSTSPVGTADYIRSLLAEGGADVAVAVNPEFLAEGTAVRDFLVPDRLVVGAWDEAAIERVMAAFAPIVERRALPRVPEEIQRAMRDATDRTPVVTSTPPTAELTKYAANAFLAVKISFINEIASVAEQVGADVADIATAVGLDHRIGPHFLRAGIGWGGSCFPKDILALQGLAETYGLKGLMLRAANDVNHEQRHWVTRQLQRHLKTLHGRRVGLLGLAFKPDTDDLRNAPALEIAEELARLNMRVRAYDPVVRALPSEQAEFVELARDATEAAREADALVLVTDWPEFQDLDLGTLRAQMRTPLLLDGRNQLAPESARRAGFRYVGVGRSEHDAWLPGSSEGSSPLEESRNPSSGGRPLLHPVPASPTAE